MVMLVIANIYLFRSELRMEVKSVVSVEWVEPTSARQEAASTAVLTDQDVSTWRENGYCLVNDVLPEELLERVLAASREVFPAPLSEAAAQITDFGCGQLRFPSRYDCVNQLALHPRLLAAAAQLLGEPDAMDLRLTQTEIWPKYGRTSTSEKDFKDNADQRMHCDFTSHTLTHPPPWYSPDAVEIIIYLSTVEECDGATAVVPRSGSNDPAYQYPIYQMPGMGLLDYYNNRQICEAYLQRVDPDVAQFRATHLYSREKKVKYQFGTVLFYRHDTWHRGTELKRGCLRMVVNMTYKRSSADSICNMHQGWAWELHHRNIQMMMATISVEQRTVLGFPKPGHHYWNEQTLLALAARYGALGFDMKPYIDAYHKKNDSQQ